MNATSGDLARAGAAACLAVLLVTRAAAAAPPSENVATARELYKQGADALDAHDVKTAVTKLKSAWSLVQTPVIGFDLARAYLATGQLVDAREAALAVMRIPVAFDETDRSRRARDEAAKLAEALAKRIPHVTIRIEGKEVEQATIKLDGIVIPRDALTVARQANPGAHTATIDVEDGRHAEGTVTVAEGESKELVLTVPAPAPKPPPDVKGDSPKHDVVVAPPPDTRPRERVTYVSPLVWVGAVTTGAGLALGAITGAVALGAASTVSAHCNVLTKDGVGVCPPQYASDLSTGNTAAALSTVGFIAAGVGAGVLVTGILLSGKRDAPASAARVVPMLGGTMGAALVLPAPF